MSASMSQESILLADYLMSAIFASGTNVKTGVAGSNVTAAASNGPVERYSHHSAVLVDLARSGRVQIGRSPHRTGLHVCGHENAVDRHAAARP